MSAAKTGHAGVGELLGDSLEALRLARARRAGDQAVAVHHPQRDLDERLGGRPSRRGPLGRARARRPASRRRRRSSSRNPWSAPSSSARGESMRALRALPGCGRCGRRRRGRRASSRREKCVAPSCAPLLDLGAPVVRRAARDVDPPLDPDLRRVAAGLLDPAAEALHRRRPAAVERPLREEAVREASRAPERRLGGAADPDRDRPLDGERVDPGARDAVPAALEVDDRLGPEPAHHLDLLLRAPAAVAEVLAERLELDEVPAEPDAEPEVPAREDVDLGRLLRDERGLPLRQHEHAGDELEPGRRPRRGSRRGRRARGTGARTCTARASRRGRRRRRRARGRRRAGGRSRAPATACANSRTPPGSAPISVCGKTTPSFTDGSYDWWAEISTFAASTHSPAASPSGKEKPRINGAFCERGTGLEPATLSLGS